MQSTLIAPCIGPRRGAADPSFRAISGKGLSTRPLPPPPTVPATAITAEHQSGAVPLHKLRREVRVSAVRYEYADRSA